MASFFFVWPGLSVWVLLWSKDFQKYVKGCCIGLPSAQSEYLCKPSLQPDVHLYPSTVPSSQVFVRWRCILLCGCRRPPAASLLPSLPSLILSAMPQPHYAALICFTSDIQGKTLAACVDYTLQDHDRSAENIGWESQLE